jgi:hypothetical protein
VAGYDAIIIPGGGVREGGEITPWAAARFDRALERNAGQLFLCLSAGTTHRPPPLESGFPVLESVAGARYLMARGVEPDRILLESSSYDTIGNAYLARLLHVDPAGWQRVLVITSRFHMPRTKAIFEWVFGMAPRTCRVDFDSAPDTGITREGLRMREAKESAALEDFLRLRSRIKGLRELNSWFFTMHAAYSAAGMTQPKGGAEDPHLVESY